jgi:hypothetical protein
MKTLQKNAGAMLNRQLAEGVRLSYFKINSLLCLLGKARNRFLLKIFCKQLEGSGAVTSASCLFLIVSAVGTSSALT